MQCPTNLLLSSLVTSVGTCMPSDMPYCDHMAEQIPPTATWGTEFYTASFMTRPRDRFRVVSSRDNNSITWTCVGDNQTSNGRNIPRAGEAIEFEIQAVA